MTGLGHKYSMEQQLIPNYFINWYISLFNNTQTQINEISMMTKAYPLGKANPSFILSDEEIEKIKRPMLLLWSKDDPFGGVETAQRLKTTIRTASLVSFEGRGHLPWLDNPERHAEEIKKFIPDKSSE